MASLGDLTARNVASVPPDTEDDDGDDLWINRFAVAVGVITALILAVLMLMLVLN